MSREQQKAVGSPGVWETSLLEKGLAEPPAQRARDQAWLGGSRELGGHWQRR